MKTRRQWSLCRKVVQMHQAKEGWFADKRKEGRTGGLLPQVSSLSSGESRTLLTRGLGGAAAEEIGGQFAVWGTVESPGQRHRRLRGIPVSTRGRGCRVFMAAGPVPPGPRARSCRPPGCSSPACFTWSPWASLLPSSRCSFAGITFSSLFSAGVSPPRAVRPPRTGLVSPGQGVGWRSVWCRPL